MNIREFAQHKFDVLVLLLVNVLLCLLLLHFAHDEHAVKSLDWTLQALGTSLGALLMALQASRVASRNSDRNSADGKKNGLTNPPPG